jgi:membrane fusion protein (multidrug efflux system)
MSSSPASPPGPPPASQSASPLSRDATPAFLATVGNTIRELPRLAKFSLVALTLVLLFTCYIWMGWVSTDDAQVDAHITAVASQVSGYVVALPTNDNVDAKEGDVLLQIDPREYKAEADQAKASLDLAVAEAKSAELQIGLTRATTTHSTGSAVAQHDSDAADYTVSEEQLERAATANLLEAKAEVASKRATKERAEADLERYKPLVKPEMFRSFNSTPSTRPRAWRKTTLHPLNNNWPPRSRMLTSHRPQ